MRAASAATGYEEVGAWWASHWRAFTAPLVLVVALAAAYGNALAIPFLWDDLLLLETVRGAEARHGLDVFSEVVWNAGGETYRYYRPLVIQSLRVDDVIWGGHPAGYHATNLLFHFLNTWLVFVLCRRAGVRAPGAVLAALSFGLFPRLTENVSWVSGRTDVLAATGALTALVLYCDASAGTGRRVAAALAIFAGLLAKEVAVSGAVAIAFYEWVSSRRVRDGLKRLLPILIAGLLYALLRLSAGARIGDELELAAGDGGAFAFQALGTYAAMLLRPFHPQLRIGLLGKFEVWPYAAGVIVATLLLAAVALMLKRRWDALLAAALGLGVSSIALVLHLVPITVDVVAADRFLYLPVAALVIAGASGLACSPLRLRRIVAVTACAMLPLFAITVHARNAVWTDEISFWEDAIESAHPLDVGPRNAFASVLFDRGEIERSLTLYREAFAAVPEFAVLERIGVCLRELERYAEAQQAFERLVAVDPSLPENHFNLAFIQFRRMDFDAAGMAVARALALEPDLPPATQLERAILAARADFAALPPERSDESTSVRAQRALLETRLGRRRRPAELWREVLAAPDATEEERRRAAGFLLAHDEREATSPGRS